MAAQPTGGDRYGGPAVDVRARRAEPLEVCEWRDTDDAATLVALWRHMNGTRCEARRLSA